MADDGNIKSFPDDQERERRINTRKRIVPCAVSDRWLQFSENIYLSSDGRYLSIDIMKTTDDEDNNSRDYRLCELVVNREDLERVLAEFNKHENDQT